MIGRGLQVGSASALFGMVMTLAAFAYGCGGRAHHFSAGAVPVALKMRDALHRSNTSDLAGCVDRARELRTAGAISDADLKLVIIIYDLAWGNSWDDARKMLEEALAGSS